MVFVGFLETSMAEVWNSLIGKKEKGSHFSFLQSKYHFADVVQSNQGRLSLHQDKKKLLLVARDVSGFIKLPLKEERVILVPDSVQEHLITNKYSVELVVMHSVQWYKASFTR